MKLSGVKGDKEEERRGAHKGRVVDTGGAYSMYNEYFA